MKNILLLNKIAKVGTDKLDPAVYHFGTEVEAPEGIMVRSAKMHDMVFNKELLANHIKTCVAEDIKNGKEETVDELVATLQKLMK